MKKFVSGLLFFLLSVYSLFSLDNPDTPGECQWRIGVFEFKTEDDSSILLNLKNTIPREIVLGLSGPICHHITFEEKKILIQKEEKKIRIQLGLELSALYTKRDLLFLSGKTKKEERDKIIQAIVEKKEEMAQVNAASKEVCTDSSPAIEINPKNENGQLYPLTADSLTSIPLSDNLETAVYGRLEMVDQWIAVSVYLYNYLTDKNERVYQNLVDPGAVNDILPEIILILKKKLTGAGLPVLFVTGKPFDAFFNLDNGKSYLSNTPLSLVTAGTYNLKIHRKGYLPVQKNIILRNGEKTTVPYTLQKEKTGYISLTTFPSDADIYSGSLWIGKSPFILEDPVFPLYLSFKKDGYHALRTIVDKNTPSRDKRYFLVPEKVDINRMIDARRKSFYQSFAFFVVSLSVPVISYGISSDYGYAFNTFVTNTIINTDSLYREEHRLMDSSTLWYNLYLGGVFVSASLFINTAVELWNYIKLYQ